MLQVKAFVCFIEFNCHKCVLITSIHNLLKWCTLKVGSRETGTKRKGNWSGKTLKVGKYVGKYKFSRQLVNPDAFPVF